MVEGLSGIPTNPITPAVIINGSKLGIKEIKIILNDLKRYAMNKAKLELQELKENKKQYEI